MGKISKGFSLLLFGILVVSSLMIVNSALAQTIPKPSVPQFTLRYVENPFDVPPRTTSSIDPYSGKVTNITHPGYHVDNRTIQMIIKNQKYNGNLQLYYNYSYKEHNESDWQYHKTGTYDRDSPGPSFDYQSTSDYTVIAFVAVPKEGQIDVRVQAQIGYYNETKLDWAIPRAPYLRYTFVGEVSGWSEMQTITIPSISIASPSPTVPEFPSWIILLFTVIILSTSLLGYFKKYQKKKITQSFL